MKRIVNIKTIKPNEENPRWISDAKFKKLVKSIKEFPEMLEARPLVIDENNIVLGGNMRLKALQSAGVFEVPVEQVLDWTEEQKKEFIIKDNVGFGEWDWDILANRWDTAVLPEWGLDTVKYDWEDLDYIDENVDKPELKSNNTITIHIPDALIDERNKIEDDVKSFLSDNYSGCEVK